MRCLAAAMTHAFQSLSGGPAATLLLAPPARLDAAPLATGVGAAGSGGWYSGDVDRSSANEYFDPSYTSGQHRWVNAMKAHHLRAGAVRCAMCGGVLGWHGWQRWLGLGLGGRT